MTATIGVVYDEKVDAESMWCLMALRRHPDVVDLIRVPGGPGNFDVARNKVVAYFLTHSLATHLLMVDTDMMYTVDDFEALVDHQVPLVSALYFVADNPPRPNFVNREWNGALKAPESWATGLRHADGFGCGFCLVERDVLTDIGPRTDEARGGPWFRQDAMGASGQVLEPDYAFVQRVQQAGHPTFVDTGTIVGHIKPRVLYG